MGEGDERDVTRLLRAVERGEEGAWSRLLPLVYDELRALGRARLRGLAEGRTLQATALVHEAYVRLVGEGGAWEDRAHFYAAAARSMRNILVDAARARARDKRGGAWRRVALDEGLVPGGDGGRAPLDLLALDEALQRLEERDATQHQIVVLRYFGGLAMPEVARAVGVSLATCERHWSFARAWLFRELAAGGGEAR